MSLPDPATLEDAVERATGENAVTPPESVDVAVHGTPAPAAVEVTDEGYVGEAAGPTGRLAAALAVAEGRESLSLRHPDPDFTAVGPWLVLAPLAGFLTTVATGVGRVEVTADYDADADPAFERFDSLVADLVSDLLVIGGFDDLFVDVDLGGAYHELTVGAARAAHERGVVEHRDG